MKKIIDWIADTDLRTYTVVAILYFVMFLCFTFSAIMLTKVLV